jgi:hypothetical protein
MNRKFSHLKGGEKMSGLQIALTAVMFATLFVTIYNWLIDRKGHLIGLSLSFCVKDILDGWVDVKDVKVIYTNCVFDDPMACVDLPNYLEVYWSDYTRDEVVEVIRELGSKLKPRRHRSHNIHPGQWMSEFKEWGDYHMYDIAYGTYWDPKSDTFKEYHGEGDLWR